MLQSPTHPQNDKSMKILCLSQMSQKKKAKWQRQEETSESAAEFRCMKKDKKKTKPYDYDPTVCFIKLDFGVGPESNHIFFLFLDFIILFL